MTGKDALFIGGAIALMALAVALLKFWQDWRKRSLAAAGEAFGFRRLVPGESLPVVLVPLIERANRSYFVILRGELNGHEAAYFDLTVTSGKDWGLQSTVLVKNPKVMMPKFQLMTPRMLQWRQPTCGDAVAVPGREADMGSLRLSSSDTAWAREKFSKATVDFFQEVEGGKWTVEGLEHSVVVYRWGERIGAGALREYVQQAGKLAENVFSLSA